MYIRTTNASRRADEGAPKFSHLSVSYKAFDMPHPDGTTRTMYIPTDHGPAYSKLRQVSKSLGYSRKRVKNIWEKSL